MTRRILVLLAVLSLAAAACGPPAFRASSPPASELGFVPQIVDIVGDAGAGVSLTTDGDGNPHLSYLSLERELAPGEQPPAPDPAAPVFPAVRHAHLTGGVWTKSTVAEELSVAEDDQTAIAVDGDGVHHVAWTEGNQVFYASNAGGDFSDPESVAQADAAGLAIAVGGDGTPSVSFYEVLAGPEGPGALVRVASPGDGGWEVETAAEADGAEPMTTGIGVGPDGPIVAYGSAGQTFVARFDGGAATPWTSEMVDRGGLGVSLDLDGDGNPHLAYYGSDGTVRHAHSVGGSPWETSDVGDAGGSPEAGWITSISLADDGTHWVAWQAAEGLMAAGNADGEFATQEVRGSAAGARPVIGAGAEGAVYLGWYDTEDRTLIASVRSDQEPLLAGPPDGAEPAPGPTDGGGGGDTGPPACEPDGTELAIVAPSGAVADGFDTDCLAAPAGEDFTIDFDNQDTGVPHNVSIYTDESAAQSLFVGDIITGDDQITYEPDPIDDPANYYFHCDVHPNMSGTFSVV